MIIRTDIPSENLSIKIQGSVLKIGRLHFSFKKTDLKASPDLPGDNVKAKELNQIKKSILIGDLSFKEFSIILHLKYLKK